MCTRSCVKSSNECRQSIPLPFRDLSQSTEAQRTSYSRAALLQRECSAYTESSVEAATESSLFDFVNQWKAYGKQISVSLAEWDDPEVFAEDEIKSRQDIRVSHRVKVAQLSLGLSACLNAASGWRPSSMHMGWWTTHGGAKGLSDVAMSYFLVSLLMLKSAAYYTETTHVSQIDTKTHRHIVLNIMSSVNS